MLATVENNTARLLPLLNLLETLDGPDRIDKLLEMLRLILDMQRQTAIAVKAIADKLHRLPRR